MGCGAEKSKWDDKAVQDSLAGKNTGIETMPKEILEGVMLAIQAKDEAMTIRCLQENVENARNEIETLAQSGVNLDELQKLDLKVAPTEEQCHIQHEVGIKLSKELGFSEHAIVNFPTIYGTRGVETTPELVEEIMRALCDFKMERELWDVTSYDGVMLIDYQTAEDFGLISKSVFGYVHLAKVLQESQQSPETIGVKLDEKTAKEIGLTRVPEPREFKTREILPRILHIVLDKNGRPLLAAKEQREGVKPTAEKYIPYGKVWTWGLAHETHHFGYHQPYGVGPIDRRIADKKDEWNKAKSAQDQKGPVAKYGSGPTDPEEEFNTQCHAAWETDSPLLCSEMKEFFDKHLAE